MMRGLLHHMLRQLLACSIGLAFLLSSFMLVQQISAPITSQHATIALVSADTPMNDPLAAMDDLLVIGATGIGVATMRRWLLGKPTSDVWKAPAPPGLVRGLDSLYDANLHRFISMLRRGSDLVPIRHLQE
jgi:hypothetical protein